MLAVVSPTEDRRRQTIGEIRVRRLGPSSVLERSVYRRLRAREGRSREDGSAPAPRRDAGAASGAPSPPRLVTRLVRLTTTLAYYRRAIGVVRALKPQLVHCNDYNTMWIGVAARLLVGSFVVYDSHELWPDRNLRPEPRWWLLLCEALFVRIAHRVVMTSPAHAEVMAERYRIPEPVVVRNIPEIVPEATPALNGNGPTFDGPPVAVYVGGLLRNRGLEESIRALALVERVHLRLIGPVAADYRAELEGLAASLDVGERVHFPGPVPPTEVVGALANAQVGLALFQPTCLSHRLVLPNKLFEYAVAGVPVVASDLPMITRFLNEHGLGVTVDPQDVEAIATGIDEVTRADRQPLYREAAARAAATLDWHVEREILKDVYRQALVAAGA